MDNQAMILLFCEKVMKQRLGMVVKILLKVELVTILLMAVKELIQPSIRTRHLPIP